VELPLLRLIMHGRLRDYACMVRCMPERPDFVPRWWGTRWPLVARWAKDRPERVLGYLVVGTVSLAIMLGVAVAISNTYGIVVLGIGVVGVLMEDRFYGRRALRARRAHRRGA
jgi:hypothetical protein